MAESKVEQLVRGTTNIATATAAAIAASHQQNDVAALISIVGAIAPDGAAHVASMWKQRLERRLPWFMKGVEEASGRSAAEAVRSEDDAESLYEAYRRLSNSSDDFAVQALGRLAGMYMSTGSQVDRFFRAAGSLIEDLDPHEYDATQTLIAAATGVGRDHHVESVGMCRKLRGGNLDAQAVGKVCWLHNRQHWFPLQGVGGAVEDIPGMARVFFLLRAHGLSTALEAGAVVRSNLLDAECMELDTRDIGPRLVEILSPRPRGPGDPSASG